MKQQLPSSSGFLSPFVCILPWSTLSQKHLFLEHFPLITLTQEHPSLKHTPLEYPAPVSAASRPNCQGTHHLLLSDNAPIPNVPQPLGAPLSIGSQHPHAPHKDALALHTLSPVRPHHCPRAWQGERRGGELSPHGQWGPALLNSPLPEGAFNPNSEDPLPGQLKKQLVLRIISGQQLPKPQDSMLGDRGEVRGTPG